MGSPEDVLVVPSLDVEGDYRETRREMWAALKTCWSSLVLMWGCDYRETRREMRAGLKTCWSALVLMWGCDYRETRREMWTALKRVLVVPSLDVGV